MRQRLPTGRPSTRVYDKVVDQGYLEVYDEGGAGMSEPRSLPEVERAGVGSIGGGGWLAGRKRQRTAALHDAGARFERAGGWGWIVGDEVTNKGDRVERIEEVLD